LSNFLQIVKNKNGKLSVFTLITLLSNSDFEKIKAADYRQHFYEPFTETLKRYQREGAFSLWKEGTAKRLFVPQFHGREHLNVQVWLRRLQNNNPHTLAAFWQGMWGFNNAGPITYQAAFDLEYPGDIAYQKTVVEEGQLLFERLHGYKALFFVTTNGSFNSQLEKPAFEGGIKYLSTSKLHHEPQGNGQYKKQLNWLGKKNKSGLRYITRNAFFEPSQTGKDWVNSCLNDIAMAFKYHKPATISTHRVNYIG
jgi:hypothetical protein